MGWILVVSANLLRPGHCGVAGRVGADQADRAGCVGAGARGGAGPLEWCTAALGRLPADGVSARRGQQLFPGVRADPGWDHQRGYDNFGQPVCLALRADRGVGQHRGAACAGPAAGDLAGGDGRHHGRVAGLRAADPGRVGAGVSGLDRPADRPVAKCAAARFNGPDFANRHPVERAFAAPVAAADHGAGRCDEPGADRVEHRADAAGCLAGQHAGAGSGASV